MHSQNQPFGETKIIVHFTNIQCVPHREHSALPLERTISEFWLFGIKPASTFNKHQAVRC